MPENVKAEGGDRLLEELRDLFTVKLALILIPVRQLLQIAGRQELGAAIEAISGDLSAELASVLSDYEVFKKDQNGSERKFPVSHIEINLDGLNRLKQRVSALHGTHRIPASELLTPAFMRSHSRFDSFQEMVVASPFAGLDFGEIPDAAWDSFVRQNTGFASWQAMLHDAATAWTKSRLFP